MKLIKKITLLFAAITIFSLSSFAQPGNVIKVNLLSPFVKSGSFFYERALNEEMSAVAGFFFTNWQPGEDVTLSGYGITLEYRYYLSQTPAPSGAFIAPFGRYQKFSIEEGVTGDMNEGNITSVGGGLLVGIQKMFKERITLEAFIGPAYYSSKTEVVGDGTISDVGQFEGFTVRGGITVGVAF